MPALNFVKKFAPLVESGKNRQTIRPCRKDGRNPKPGCTLYLYTGMRTKGCRKLKEAECISSEPIVIDDSNIAVGGNLLNHEERWQLARADGFPYTADFREFFRKQYGLPFSGYLIKW